MGDSEARTPQSISPFGWQFETLPLRGGTTQGEAVQLRAASSNGWDRLREEGLDSVERDRRAILAMAGTYRTSFDYVETAGFSAGYQPISPYRSWGTEVVCVLDDSARKIVLQHILLMQFSDQQEPVLVKHWRQDWFYEPESVMRYRGHSRWEFESVSELDGRGAWSQIVYQVDDSPRYGGIARWQHGGGLSIWQSDPTWRPLPRRELSVRQDYQVIAGVNRHLITPTGWIHEQENNKLKLDEEGKVQVVARELGLNRYELIEKFDTQVADDYFRHTEPFWGLVRKEWTMRGAQSGAYVLTSGKKRGELAMQAFELADDVAKRGEQALVGLNVESFVGQYFKDKV